MCLKSDYCEKLVTQNYMLKKRIKELGVSTKYIAYYYLVDILDIVMDKNNSVKSFSKQVYPFLAEKYNKRECTVERDIRHIIAICWGKELEVKLIGENLNKKPSCISFIFLIKNYIINDFQ